ncbi:MAG TPA: macro domain-containing protein [Nocardioides sp.]
MITDAAGNLLEADAEALVNTVNTVGVMGKGIALQFKRAYPAMFEDYARAAKSDELALGRMHVWSTGQMAGPRFVINFPTKGHWKSRSRLADIDSGLDDLVAVIREHRITSIAVPPLGCGHGGLDWGVVEPLIHAKLGQLDGVEVLLFGPAGAPAASDIIDRTAAPALTRARAALVATLGRYADVADETSPIEVQKLMYFLEVVGEDLRLDFEPHHYGPYSDRLRHVLRELEGHQIIGFGDGSARVEDAEPIAVTPSARAEAEAFLDAHPQTSDHIAQALEVVAGFESAYSLELLATVHWIAAHPHRPDSDDDALVATVREWSPRKGRLFTEAHVRTALAALRRRQLVA